LAVDNFKLRITNYELRFFTFFFCHSERSEESVLKLMVDGMRLTFNGSRLTIIVYPLTFNF